MKRKKVMSLVLCGLITLGVATPTLTHAASASVSDMQDYMDSDEGREIADKHKDSNGYTLGYKCKFDPTSSKITVNYDDGASRIIKYHGASKKSDGDSDKSVSKSDYNYIKKVQGKSMADAMKFAEGSKGKKLIDAHNDSGWSWALSTSTDNEIAVTYGDGSKIYMNYKTGKIGKEYSSNDMQDLKERRIKNEVTKYMDKGSGKKLAEKWATDNSANKEFKWESDYKLNNKQVLINVTFDDNNAIVIDYRSNKVISSSTKAANIGTPPELPKKDVKPVTDKNLGTVTSSDVAKGLADPSNKVVDADASIVAKAMTAVGLSKSTAVEGESETAKTKQAETDIAKDFGDQVKAFMKAEGKTIADSYKGKDNQTPKYKYAMDRAKNRVIIKYSDNKLTVVDLATKQVVSPDGPIVFDPNVGDTIVNGYAVHNYLMNTEDTALNEREIYMKYHGDPSVYDAQKYPASKATGNATANTGKNSSADTTVKTTDAVMPTTTSVKGPKSSTGAVSTWSKGKYYDEQGYSTIGWKEIEGKNYYFDADGLLVRGLKEIEGKTYLLAVDDGAMAIGWQNVNDKYYYMESNGVMKNGWLEKGDGNWYYLDELNGMKTGWFKVEGKWYSANSKGMLQKEWIKQDGKYYYLGTDGALKTSTFEVGGKTYNPDSNGVCAKE